LRRHERLTSGADRKAAASKAVPAIDAVGNGATAGLRDDGTADAGDGMSAAGDGIGQRPIACKWKYWNEKQ
jgi:hypothetical protein